MRTNRFIFVITALALLPACSDDSSTPNQPVPDDLVATDIRDVDYIHRRFFYFDDPALFIGPNASTVKVYRSVLPADIQNNPAIAFIPGWAAPDPEGWGHGIGAIVLPLNAGELPTEAIEQNFEWLEPDVDYTFIRSPLNDAVIGIALAEPIPDSEMRALAVSYVTIDGWAIGGTYANSGVLPTAPDYDPNKLVLELIKAPDCDPNGMFPTTWKLEMRNVYDIGMENIDGGSLQVTLVDNLSTRDDPSMPEGSVIPYLRIFGLDQQGALGAPDGLIDVIPGTVDLEKGLLFFPASKSFHPDPAYVASWTTGGFAFTGPYQAQYDNSLAIYTEELTPTRENEVHQYVIKVLSRQE